MKQKRALLTLFYDPSNSYKAHVYNTFIMQKLCKNESNDSLFSVSVYVKKAGH